MRYSVHLSQTSVQLTPRSGTTAKFSDVMTLSFFFKFLGQLFPGNGGTTVETTLQQKANPADGGGT